MSDYASLQPSTRTPLEQKTGESQIYPVPHPVRHLWNPDTCPVALLPYLAWALSVDYWDEAWSGQQKRRLIKASWRAHKYKGTCGAIEDVAAAFGLSARFTEWWQTSPPGVPGTFRLDLFNEARPLGMSEIAEIGRLVNTVKPVSRHLAALGMGVVTRGCARAAAVAVQGAVITVYPYFIAALDAGASAKAAAAVQRGSVLTVYPRA